MTARQCPDQPHNPRTGSDLHGDGSLDVTSPEFEREARRQSLLAATSPEEEEIMDWLESVSIPFDELDHT